MENIKFEFVIDEEKNLAYIVKPGKTFKDYGYGSLGTIHCVFGNILSILENEIEPPNYNIETLSEYIVKHTVNGLENLRNGVKVKQQAIYEIPIYWGDFVPIHTFLNNEDEIYLTLEDVEYFRISNKVKVHIFPFDITHPKQNKSLRVENIQSVTDIFYGLLYYYALKKLNLKRCEHCGRWFATPTFKQKYCPRKSPYPDYTHLFCKNAVDHLSTLIAKKYREITQPAAVHLPPENEILNALHNENKKFKSGKRSVENISNYLTLLDEYKQKIKNEIKNGGT